MNYGQRKIDNQLALDYGFTDAFAPRPGYALGPIAIRPDPNASMMDVLEVAGLRGAVVCAEGVRGPGTRAEGVHEAAQPEGGDSFLLEAIFRQERGLLQPVSRLNEQVCGTMINGCEEVLWACDARGGRQEGRRGPRRGSQALPAAR